MYHIGRVRKPVCWVQLLGQKSGWSNFEGRQQAQYLVASLDHLSWEEKNPNLVPRKPSEFLG